MGFGSAGSFDHSPAASNSAGGGPINAARSSASAASVPEIETPPGRAHDVEVALEWLAAELEVDVGELGQIGIGADPRRKLDPGGGRARCRTPAHPARETVERGHQQRRLAAIDAVGARRAASSRR